LDSVPDLELISHLPAFLMGLVQFLSDPNDDVRTATQQTLSGFLQDIRKSTEVKKMLRDRKRRPSQVIYETDSGSGNSRDISPVGRVIFEDRLPEDVFEETDDWVPGQD